MKEIRRDFTLVVDVPDDVKPEDCDIVVDVASASYPGANVQPRVIVEEPYEVEPEKPPAPKPKCPKCGKMIDGLSVSWSAVIPGIASIVDGELYTDVLDGLHLGELTDDDSAIYYCPECEEELFRAGQEGEMTAFLKCENKEKA